MESPVSALLLAAFASATTALGATSAGERSCWPRCEDAYVLTIGKDCMSTNASLEVVQALRRRFSGDFLWSRRAGKTYLLRDSATLAQARAFFEPLRILEPDRAAVQRLRSPLEARERALDREQEDLDREADRLADAAQTGGSASNADLGRRQQALEKRLRTLQEEEEKVDALENRLDEKEEALERQAEAELWELIDASVARGLARSVPR